MHIRIISPLRCSASNTISVKCKTNKNVPESSLAIGDKDASSKKISGVQKIYLGGGGDSAGSTTDGRGTLLYTERGSLQISNLGF